MYNSMAFDILHFLKIMVKYYGKYNIKLTILTILSVYFIDINYICSVYNHYHYVL